MEDRIIKAGKLNRSTFGSEDAFYETEGVAPTICARDYKGPVKIAIWEAN